MGNPEEPLARRYRAARAWAGLDQDELADKLGVDRQTVIRREKGTQQPKRAELLAVAAICEVPPDFMLNGFAREVLGSEQTEQLAIQVSRIEARLEELSRGAVERDLEVAEQRRQGVGIGAGAEADPDARGGGGEG